ncbi:pulmonary surfactant-associated protein B isoform X2 [Vidua chalybeata]|uniref:pulmonary surfactant-associated protein B isoform X2 n=1 Tax=Vidua chalybeata TaxID=81927 RepID=UPI0023A8D41E|nr:pulmonary surfactant-associated protein B isoform X2 [Vidua chalybeata]
MALALPLLLALLGTTPGPPGRVLTVATGLGAPGGGCGVPPSAWCQDWVTALRCGALGRCPHLTQGPPDMDTCAMCQMVMDFLRQISNQSALEVVLDKVVGLVCPHLPFVETLCKNLAQWLVHHLLLDIQHLKPQEVCAKLKLCPGEPGAALAMPVLEVPSSHLQGSGLSPKALPLPLPLCWLCRSLVARAEAAVPVGSVATAVAGLCRALPLPVAGACQCLAERYAALALEGLLGRLGPRLLCRLFLACHSGDNGDNEHVGTLPPPWVLEAIVVRLAECVREEEPKGDGVPALSLPLGPCALGPIFWCSGPEAAQRCQALQHCQEHVWL